MTRGGLTSRPPRSQDVKEEDRLLVQLAFREEAGGAASPAMEKREPAATGAPGATPGKEK